jgi:predicted permease
VNQSHVLYDNTAAQRPQPGLLSAVTQQLFAIIAPVLVIALVGFVWEKRRLPFDTNMVSDLITYVGAPCLVTSSLMASRPEPGDMLRIVAAQILITTIIGIAGYLLLKVLGQSSKVFLPSLMFGNAGNMGLPLCLFAFGQHGLAFAVTYYATASTLQFSVGQGIASGEMSARGVVKNPVVIAIVICAVLITTDTALPQWIANTVDVMGKLMIPLMLMSLGTSLTRLKLTGFSRSLGYSAIRLLAGFTVAVVVAWALGLEGAARGSVIVQSAMPAAVFNYFFALRYDNRPDEVAGIVLISTVVSFLTLPLLMAYVLEL